MFTYRAIVLVLVCSFFLEGGTNCPKGICKFYKTYRLQTSDCYHMDLKEFPNCLSLDTEVLDLSFNRIRKLIRSNLEKYQYIKHLYLSDNLIVNIEDNVFVDLTRLETLDLSLNGLRHVSKSIFQLPSLKTLYLSQNTDLNISQLIEEAQPITSPLTKLDISYNSIENDPKDFPEFGVMPYLAVLNITGTSFTYLMPKHFAGLCNLQVLLNVNVSAYYKNICDCKIINDWLEQREVKFSKFYCNGDIRDCQELEIDPEDLSVYETCHSHKNQIQQAQLLSKIGIGVGCVLGFIIIISAIILWRCWKKKKSTKKQKIVSYRPVQGPT